MSLSLTSPTAIAVAAQAGYQNDPNRHGDRLRILLRPGIVDSLARPERQYHRPDSTLRRRLSGKRLELLKEVIPTISRVGVLTVAGPPPTGVSTALEEYEAAARALKIPIQSLQVVRGPNPDLESAFREAVKGRVATRSITARNHVLTPHTKNDCGSRPKKPIAFNARGKALRGGRRPYILWSRRF